MDEEKVRSGEELAEYLLVGSECMRKAGLAFSDQAREYLDYLDEKKKKGELTEKEAIVCCMSVYSQYFLTLFDTMPEGLRAKMLYFFLSHVKGARNMNIVTILKKRGGDVE